MMTPDEAAKEFARRKQDVLVRIALRKAFNMQNPYHKDYKPKWEENGDFCKQRVYREITGVMNGFGCSVAR